MFEVKLGFDSFKVDLESRLCTCRLWEISGIPCVHACAALNYTHQQAKGFVSNYFSKEMFAHTYKGNIRPLNGCSMWAKTPYIRPLPPMARRMPGRPTTKRKRHVTEDDGGYTRLRATGGTTICKNCWESGHNKRTCKNPAKPPPPKEKKKMGRPLKTSQTETGTKTDTGIKAGETYGSGASTKKRYFGDFKSRLLFVVAFSK